MTYEIAHPDRNGIRYRLKLMRVLGTQGKVSVDHCTKVYSFLESKGCKLHDALKILTLLVQWDSHSCWVADRKTSDQFATD